MEKCKKRILQKNIDFHHFASKRLIMLPKPTQHETYQETYKIWNRSEYVQVKIHPIVKLTKPIIALKSTKN